ncbi:transporter substrate-binding domain-containing protein [Amycolatopsis sp. H20-H5]|uniref:transporter substrate-binding domain-containing protein n=1 Tax=Amycolatopsis sp. H20-H5 TaxID=3046309 RepID=UPI002DBAD1AD|nr:transporter substrate-binding domain-containing protein [Amycolatopsis sp. H20-H5]MEC3978531.1 transporter substrate-binding domain-containing protein [Amycolatopsis sp. H20-H5]
MTINAKVASLGIALLAVLGIGTASAAPDSGQDARSRLDTITARGEVRVCGTGDYRPLTYRDAAGKWSGVDIELAADLAQRLGVRLTLVQTTWKALTDDVGTRCDLAMGGISVTLDRAKKAFFTAPIMKDGKTPITRCENVQRFGTLAQIDQPGVRVVVNPGGTNEQFAAANLHQATIVRHPDNNTIFDEILAGRADLMITDATETRWQANQHPELCAVHPDQPFTFAEKAYLLPRGDVVLQEWVDQWLHLVLNDGTYARIAKPWLG